MKKIFIILVLLFSSSVVGETFKCQLEFHDYLDKTTYELFIDTGDTDVGSAILLDKNNSFKQIITTTIKSVGKIYSDNYPLAGQKISDDAYFTLISPWSVGGFFVHVGNIVLFYIDIKQLSDKISIRVLDQNHTLLSETNSKGFCE